MSSIGVYHLVRHANGMAPFQTFVRSLREHVPGRPWTLVLIFKGFDRRDEAAPYLSEVGDLPVETVFVGDEGTDIFAYFQAAAATSHPIACFLNSFSVIVAPRWLELMVDQLERPGVGLVGATGSLESVVRNHRVYAQAAPSLGRKARMYALSTGLRALFPPFPNPHVRTNAFALRREHFLAARKLPVRGRFAALLFESGRLSLTRQIQRRGLEVLIVDREGRGLSPDQWAAAGAFRSGGQDRLIVRDNRILEYERADADRRRLLRRLAFGDDAG